MSWRTWTTAAVLLGASALPALAGEASGEDVEIRTHDHKKIAATWWDEPAAKAPGVVLLHMYQSDRTAWEPLVTHLRSRGVEVLAIDMRGHGGSTKQGGVDLSRKVEKRDPKLFADMHEDAIAAVRWLVKKGGCDPERIALVGASVGCSVALDTAQRYPGETRAVVCMTPGAAYLGLDSLEHVKTFPETEALLLLAHESEADGGARAIHEAVPTSRLIVYPDGPAGGGEAKPGWAHGTRMFGAMPLVEQTVASFVAAHLGSKTDEVVLDGTVAAEAADGGPWTRATKLTTYDGVEAWAYRVGRRVVFGGRVRGDALKGLEVGMDTHFPAGTQPGFSTDPELGFPEVAAVDLAAGRFAWVEPMDSGRKAGNKDFAARIRPAVRVVPCEGGFEFEGEWITEYGDGAKGPVDPSKVRLAILAGPAVEERPRELAPGAMALPMGWADAAVEVVAR